MVNWFMEHFVIGVVGVAVGGCVITWLTGLFNNILPSPKRTQVLIDEFVKDLWYSRPSRDKFLVLVAQLDRDDPEGTHTRAVARAFLGQPNIERTLTRRPLTLAGIGSEAESGAVTTGRRWLARRNADLLIWGEVLQKEKLLNLWFTSKDATSDFQQSRFMLEANLLGQSFNEVAKTQLIAVALSAIKPATEVGMTSRRNILRPVADRLRNLTNNSSEFTSRQRSDLSFALGVTLCAISHEEGGLKDPEEAVSVLTSAVEGIDRNEDPLAWANAQHYRGVALTALGREASPSEALENAVRVFRAALDERTQERVPLEWANSKCARYRTRRVGYAATRRGILC